MKTFTIFFFKKCYQMFVHIGGFLFFHEMMVIMMTAFLPRLLDLVPVRDGELGEVATEMQFFPR